MNLNNWLKSLIESMSKKNEPKRRKKKRLAAEALEDRRMLATLTVGTTVDELDGDTSSIANLIATPGGTGISLREAISAANNTAGADTINLPAGTYILSQNGDGEDANLTGDLDLTDSAQTTINGAGARTTIIDANFIDRVIDLRPNAAVEINGVTIQNGLADILNEDGGGIRVVGAGMLTVNDSRLTNNESVDDGGAIVMTGPNPTATSVVINRSLIDNNKVQTGTTALGGGIANIGGGLEINNSTISGNLATNRGGGITSQIAIGHVDLTLTNVTVSENQAPFGSGVHVHDANGQAPAVISNSIISGNTGAPDLQVFAGPAPTQINNLVGGTTASFMNTTLADNGGPTDTYALVGGGAAVDSGDNASATGLLTDQRGTGFDRVVNGAVDIGAFEFGATLPDPAVIVQPIAVVNNSMGNFGNFFFSEPATIDQSGLSANYVSGVDDFDTVTGSITHNNDAGTGSGPAHIWGGLDGNNDFIDGVFDVDLGGTYDISRMAYWARDEFGTDMLNFTVFADDEPTFTGAANLGNFDAAVFGLPSASPAQVFDTADVNDVRYIRVQIHSNYGNVRHATIGELAFAATGVTQPVNYDFTVASFSDAEGNATNTTNVVMLTRDDSSAAEDVDVVLTGNTAGAGSDFTAGPVTVSFGIGESTKSVPIELLGDMTVELDETIDLSLTDFSGSGQAGTTNPTATLTINNDDQATITIDDVSQVETDSGQTAFDSQFRSTSQPVTISRS